MSLPLWLHGPMFLLGGCVAGSMFLLGGLCFKGCLCLGVSVQRVSVWGSLSRGLSRGSSLHGGLGRPPRIRKVGSTTSYWNALLLTRRDLTHSIHINFDFTTGTDKKTTFYIVMWKCYFSISCCLWFRFIMIFTSLGNQNISPRVHYSKELVFAVFVQNLQ